MSAKVLVVSVGGRVFAGQLGILHMVQLSVDMPFEQNNVMSSLFDFCFRNNSVVL